MKIHKLSFLPSLFVFMIAMSAEALPQSELDPEAKRAVQNSDVEALSDWIRNGGDINQASDPGNTLLMLASKIGDRPTLELLLSKHPNVNHQNDAGATALMIAAKYGHSHVVEMLLENGADPTIKNDEGATAAHFALAYNNNEVYQQLRDAITVAIIKNS